MTDKPLLMVTASKTVSSNGVGHVYVETEDGKKIAAVWGTAEEKLKHAYLFSAAPQLYEYLERRLQELILNGQTASKIELQDLLAYARGERATP